MARLRLTSPYPDQASYTRHIDDPAPVTQGVRFLLQHLPDGVFGAEEDGAGVDGQGSIKIVVVGFVETAGFRGGAGVVD